MNECKLVSEFFLVLLPETVAQREEVEVPLLVQIPHIGLLSRVLRLVLVDQVHQEKHVVGEVVLFFTVDLEAMRRLLVEILLAQTTDETLGLK